MSISALVGGAPSGFSRGSVLSTQRYGGIAPYFMKIVVEVNTSGRPHVSKLWLEVSKGVLPVKCSCYSKSFFVSIESCEHQQTVMKLR